MLAIVGVVLVMLSLVGAGVVVYLLPNESGRLKAILFAETPRENQMRKDIARRKKRRESLLGLATLLFTVGMFLLVIGARH